ncbi:transposase [[Kitasatospora] papulosa]|uniref:transposase n=1 Tax=[Kitasatospora] papulosa TaxID=1464011 RepID=UPI0037D48F90
MPAVILSSPSRPQGLLLAGLPRPLGAGTHPARRTDRCRLGQPQHPSGRAGLKRYEAEHDWLTTVRLQPYAPDLNPVEAVWSLVRRAMANTAFTTPDDLDRKLRSELHRIQLRPRLIDGCLTATRLAVNPPTPP